MLTITVITPVVFLSSILHMRRYAWYCTRLSPTQ